MVAGIAADWHSACCSARSFSAARSEPELLRKFEINVSEQGLFSRLGPASKSRRTAARSPTQPARRARSRSLVLRPLDRFQETVLATGEGAAGPYHPFFSPNGDWLGYVTPGELKKISASGGAPITLAEVDRSRGASWGPDGTIVYARSVLTGLSLVSAAGGDPTPLTELDEAAGEQSHRWPQWLPGGKAVLFSSLVQGGQFAFEDGIIEVVMVETGERKIVHRGGYYPRYVPTGHILYVHEGTLFALPFDAKRLKVTGSQMPVLEGLETNAGQGSAQYAVSDTGLLVYLEGSEELKPFPIVWADREGRTESLWTDPGIYGSPRLSPDGGRLAVSVQRDGNWDVWVYDLERDVATRITFGEAYDADPVWSPDGRWLAYEAEVEGVDGIFRKRTDGTGDAEMLLEPGKLTFPAPHSWSPDGRHIAIQVSGEGGQTDIWMLPLGEMAPASRNPMSPLLSPRQDRLFRRTGAGWPTTRPRPAGRRYSLPRSHPVAGSGRSRTAAAPRPCGQATAASSSTAPTPASCRSGSRPTESPSGRADLKSSSKGIFSVGCGVFCCRASTSPITPSRPTAGASSCSRAAPKVRWPPRPRSFSGGSKKFVVSPKRALTDRSRLSPAQTQPTPTPASPARKKARKKMQDLLDKLDRSSQGKDEGSILPDPKN